MARSPSPTFTTGNSWSHGLSGHAPGLARQCACIRVTSTPTNYDATVTSAELWGEFAHDPRSRAYASMRASDADRDVVLRALTEAYAEGRIDPDELDERTTGVQAARTLGELPPYLADLVPAADSAAVPAVPALSAQQVEAEAVARWRKSRGEALRMWLFVSAVCWAIWLITSGGDSHPWPVYPMLGTAIPLAGTLVQRREMIESNRRRIVAKHEKAVARAQAKAEKRRAELEAPPDDQTAD